MNGASLARSGPPRQPRRSLQQRHASRNLTPALWVSADTYYNVGGETSVDGVGQANAADTLRLGAGLGISLWSGGDLTLNYERVVAKPVG